MKTIAIVCLPGDIHVFAAQEALRAKGATVLLWYTSDFARYSRESFQFGNGGMSFRAQGPEMDTEDPTVDTVWARRIGFSQSYDGLHPADRSFAEIERRRFREGALQVAFPEAFWVNPAHASLRCENKLFQHSVAAKIGFELPPSLFTNDAGEIRAFLKAHGDRIIYKPLGSSGWSDGERTWACHTVALTEADLVDDALLLAVPGIYQALIPKSYEIRLTMVGCRPFAAKILSQETESSLIDWRRGYSEVRMEPIDVPSSLVRGCLRLMERLGLVFGCFDFIVTPSDDYIFLEVNQMGQFLFVEELTGLPILDAFAEFLIQGKMDFEWNPGRGAVAFSAVASKAADLSKESLKSHETPQLVPVNEEAN